MDFREGYQREMEGIRHNKNMDKKILDAMEKPINKAPSFGRWKFAAAALACVVVVSMNFDSAVTYAKAIFGNFSLIAGGEKIQLSELAPIDFEWEKHIAYEKTEKLNDSYWCCYENQASFKEHTGITLSESDKLQLQNIVIDANTKYKTGHLSMEVVYDSSEYGMNGMFILDGYNQDEYGYGERDKAYYVYEYADGKKAYFVKDRDYDDLQKVYFSEGGIMYQLFVEKSDEGKDIGKKIVDAMAE